MSSVGGTPVVREQFVDTAVQLRGQTFEHAGHARSEPDELGAGRCVGPVGDDVRRQGHRPDDHTRAGGDRAVEGAGGAVDDGARHRKKAVFAQDVLQGTPGFAR